jgi:hypothetical protein
MQFIRKTKGMPFDMVLRPCVWVRVEGFSSLHTVTLVSVPSQFAMAISFAYYLDINCQLFFVRTEQIISTLVMLMCTISKAVEGCRTIRVGSRLARSSICAEPAKRCPRQPLGTHDHLQLLAGRSRHSQGLISWAHNDRLTAARSSHTAEPHTLRNQILPQRTEQALPRQVACSSTSEVMTTASRHTHSIARRTSKLHLQPTHLHRSPLLTRLSNSQNSLAVYTPLPMERCGVLGLPSRDLLERFQSRLPGPGHSAFRTTS